MSDIKSLERQIEDRVQFYRDDIIKLTMDLVSRDTTKSTGSKEYPFGVGLASALDYLLEKASGYGLNNSKNVDNSFGIIDFGDDDCQTLVMIMNHLDEVPAGSGWTHDPYGEIEDGFMYGRGVADNKGPLVASIFSLIILNELDFVPKNKIRLFIGLDEESGSGCVDAYKARKFKTPSFGITPDAKFPIVEEEYGIVNIEAIFDVDKADIHAAGNGQHNVIPSSFVLSTVDSEEVFKGKSSHSATPERADNAIHHFICESEYAREILNENVVEYLKSINKNGRFIEKIDGIEIEFCINVLDVVDGRARLVVDCRTPGNVDAIEIRQHLVQILDIEERQIESEQVADGYCYRNDLVKDLLLENFLSKFNGKGNTDPIVLHGGTYGKAFNRIFPYGISFPDSEKSFAHGPDEKMSVDKLIEGTYILACAILKLSMFTENK